MFVQTRGQTNYINFHEQKYKLFKHTKTYSIKNKKGEYQTQINQEDIDKLNEPLRALAAFYSAYISSDCVDSFNQQYCDLTMALRLGEQGSNKHVEILKKWFPNESMIKNFINDNCHVTRPGSSLFNGYEYLNFIVKHDTIIISYKFFTYNRGLSNFFIVKDIALIKKDQIIFIKKRWR